MAGRPVWKIVLQNLISSLKPRQIRGNKIGKDYNGNAYFEIPADRSVGRRKVSRWFDPPTKLQFDNPIPAEWEAWLRMRREQPPTKEEIDRNLAVAKMKKENAARLERERRTELIGRGEDADLPTPERGMDSYPKYEDYDHGDTKRKLDAPQDIFDRKEKKNV